MWHIKKALAPHDQESLRVYRHQHNTRNDKGIRVPKHDKHTRGNTKELTAFEQYVMGRRQKNWKQIAAIRKNVAAKRQRLAESQAEGGGDQSLTDQANDSGLQQSFEMTEDEEVEIEAANVDGGGGDNAAGHSATRPVNDGFPALGANEYICIRRSVMFFLRNGYSGTGSITFAPWEQTYGNGSSANRGWDATSAVPGVAYRQWLHTDIVGRGFWIGGALTSALGQQQWNVFSCKGFQGNTAIGEIDNDWQDEFKIINVETELQPNNAESALTGTNTQQDPEIYLSIAGSDSEWITDDGANNMTMWDLGSTNTGLRTEIARASYTESLRFSQDYVKVKMGDTPFTIRHKMRGDTVKTISKATSTTYMNNKINLNSYETDWFEVAGATNIATQVLRTQMHAKQGTLTKTLEAASYNSATTGIADKVDNYIAIPYEQRMMVIARKVQC